MSPHLALSYLISPHLRSFASYLQKSVRDLRLQLEAQQTENTQLRNLNARHKGDGEIKIAELSNTIRTLSQRSDLHELLTEARQELELERLASHHLRSDVDGYRRLLEEEQRKVRPMRNALSDTRENEERGMQKYL